MSEGISPSPRGGRPGFSVNTHNLIGGLTVAVLALWFLGYAFYVPNAALMTLFCVLLFVYLLNLPFQLWPRFY
jgi:hypothetical protein